jgi:hypothetical protein
LIATPQTCLNGTLSLSGTRTNTGNIIATLTTNLYANFEISGHLLPFTGNGSGTLQIPLMLTTGDGVKTISRTLWTGGHQSITGTVNITLDTTVPPPPSTPPSNVGGG